MLFEGRRFVIRRSVHVCSRIFSTHEEDIKLSASQPVVAGETLSHKQTDYFLKLDHTLKAT